MIQNEHVSVSGIVVVIDDTIIIIAIIQKDKAKIMFVKVLGKLKSRI